jgi:hypothetical protein
MNNLALYEERVERLINTGLEVEQANCPVDHIFLEGVYIRQITIPAGVAIVGLCHKTKHLNKLVKGRMTLIKEDLSSVEVTAPYMCFSNPGRKVAYAHEESVWQNIHATDEQNVESLEAMLLVQDERLDAVINRKLLQKDYTEDHKDFVQAITEHGFTEEQVRQVSLLEDVVPFPLGSYKVSTYKSPIEGKGLFATGNFEEGELIAPMTWLGSRTPAGRYTNHSKTPNAKAVISNNEMYLVATTPIMGYRGGVIGQEITVDYRQVLSLGRKPCQQPS